MTTTTASKATLDAPITEGTPTTWRIRLPHYYSARKPLTFEHTPAGRLRLTLTSNSHLHRMKQASLEKRLRETAARLLTAQNIPPQQYVRAWVELHDPKPGVRYVRDSDNLAAMSKPLFDALQPAKPARVQQCRDRKTGRSYFRKIGPLPGAGIVPDDSDKYVYKDRPQIIRGSGLYPEPAIVLCVEGLLA